MQRTPHSFIKIAKERKNVAFFWKEHMPNPAFFIPNYKFLQCPIDIVTNTELRNPMPKSGLVGFN